MKGFDRSLRPEWIYRFIEVVEPGDKIMDHDDEFREILWQLDGDVGKRKVRTVISRYYFRSSGNNRSETVEDLLVIQISKTHTLEEVKPLLLYHLLIRAPILRMFTKMIEDIYGSKNTINYTFLRKKVIEKMGERKITKESLTSYMATLVNFGVLKKSKDGRVFEIVSKLKLDEKALIYAIYEFATEKKRSKRIFIDDFEKTLSLFFDYPDIENVVVKYNNELWSYKVMINKKYISLKVPAKKIVDIAESSLGTNA